MKTLIAIVAPLMAIAVHAADVRIVNNVHVDLTPVHNWTENHEGDRPMPHWKQIKVQQISASVPWPTCKVDVDGKTKTVYLKNIPPSAIQYWNQFNDLTTRIANLNSHISTDTKRLTSADAAYAEYGSEFYQNREIFRANLKNDKQTRDELKDKLSELQEQKEHMTSDFAMFTGQIYNKLEVWDCGTKSP